MTVRIATNLMLPADLVAEVDEVAGPRNRSRFFEEAVRTKLRREQLRVAVQASAGAWRVEDYPEFATSEMVADWVRARRAEVTDPGAEL